MKIIALTGSNSHAQAEAAELLLSMSTQDGVSLFLATGIDDGEYITAVRLNGHHCELWRVGEDITRPALDALVTAHITPCDLAGHLPDAIKRELQAFYSKTAAAGSATTAQEQPA